MHEGITIAVSYKRLFHLLIKRNMTTAQLQHQAGFSANITTRMKRNGYLSLDTIESICRILGCDVDDILETFKEYRRNPFERKSAKTRMEQNYTLAEKEWEAQRNGQ